MNSIPSTSGKPSLTEVFARDQRELKALDDFIAYKDTLVIRGGVNLYKNLKTTDNLRRFKKYLEEFPQSNKGAFYELSFWPNEVQNYDGNDGVTREAKEAPTNSNIAFDIHANVEDTRAVDLIMTTMPTIETIFVGSKDKPPPEPSQRVTGGKKRAGTNRAISEVVYNEEIDCFPPYNLETDIIIGQFVALTMELSEIQGGVPFYIGKIIEFKQGR